MHRLAIIVFAFLLGCNHRAGSAQATTQPASTAAGTTHPVVQEGVRQIVALSDQDHQLKAIKLHYGIYLARLDVSITVSPDGMLRGVQTLNKSYSPSDIDPKNEIIEVHEGRLNTEQIAELGRVFTDWDALSTTQYGGVADGGNVSIRYGEKTICGGSAVPKQVTDARLCLMELSESMPKVKR